LVAMVLLISALKAHLPFGSCTMFYIDRYNV